MKITKKAAALLTSVLLACSAGGFMIHTPAGEQEKKLKVVTTVFPAYDWVSRIMGEKAGEAEITLLSGSGTDMHSYQPSAADIIGIDQCDLFIYVGGTSEQWVKDVLEGSENGKRVAVCLMDALGEQVKAEEIVEGMQEEHDGETEHDPDHGEEMDEHVWLSLKNAEVLCDRIAGALEEADPANADLYRENEKDYRVSLEELDRRYEQMTGSAPIKTIIVADRFPFRYLADDYGLNYYAAFSGCSAETEASFETIIFLADKVKELGLGTVLTIEGSDQRIAQTVIQTTKESGLKILTMDSMQSVSSDPVSYLSVMEDNLEVLTAALDG